jgi:phosphatidylglycerophosphate synthase
VQTRTSAPVDGPTIGVVAQCTVLVMLAATVGLGLAGWLTGVTFAMVVWALLARGLHASGHTSLGPANAVTLARATLVGAVTALVVDTLDGGAPVPLLVTLATVALILDAVDGYVARLTGSTSAVGARFDMETDAFLIMVLSVFVAQSFGVWVLAIGALRYLFVGAARHLPWLRGTLPPRQSRKVVAAVQGIVLTVASAGVVWDALAFVAVATALGLLCWSFALDIRWLWSARFRDLYRVSLLR